MKREQIFVSDGFHEEMERLHLQYKLGNIQVPEKFKGRRMTKNLVYLIALDEHFTEKYNYKGGVIDN